jgi:hypothetical protein
VIRGADRCDSSAADPNIDVESGSAEPDDLRICGPTEGAEEDGITDRLEEVRLTLRVGAEQDHPFGGWLELEVGKVAKASSHHMLEPH